MMKHPESLDLLEKKDTLHTGICHRHHIPFTMAPTPSAATARFARATAKSEALFVVNHNDTESARPTSEDIVGGSARPCRRRRPVRRRPGSLFVNGGWWCWTTLSLVVLGWTTLSVYNSHWQVWRDNVGNNTDSLRIGSTSDHTNTNNGDGDNDSVENDPLAIVLPKKVLEYDYAKFSFFNQFMQDFYFGGLCHHIFSSSKTPWAPLKNVRGAYFITMMLAEPNNNDNTKNSIPESSSAADIDAIPVSSKPLEERGALGATPKSLIRQALLINITFNCHDVFLKSESGTGNFLSAFYGLRLVAATLGKVAVFTHCDDAHEQQSSLILPWVLGSFPAISIPYAATMPKKSNQLPTASAVATPETMTSGINTKDRRIDQYEWTRPTLESICGLYNYNPLGYMIHELRWDLRRMAIALVGVPSSVDHPALLWAEQYLWPDTTTANSNVSFTTRMQLDQSTALSFLPPPPYSLTPIPRPTMQLSDPVRSQIPLFPNVVLDDSVLHFRCGDLVNSTHASFAWMKFASFSRHLNPASTKSIGIITQPFRNSSQVRDMDGEQEYGDKCLTMVQSFVQHLQERFPSARITVHNGPEETIALAYARMIMAEQTVTGISTFGVFAGAAAFGSSYIFKPNFDSCVNQWLVRDPAIDQIVDNVVLIEEPHMLVKDFRDLWHTQGPESALEWLNSPV